MVPDSLLSVFDEYELEVRCWAFIFHVLIGGYFAKKCVSCRYSYFVNSVHAFGLRVN